MIAALVLAAGPGTRLGQLGARVPKTMIHIGGRPYLEHLAVQLLSAGLRPVVVAIHHHAEMIWNHFGRDPQWSDMTLVFTGQRGTGADLLDCLTRVPTDAFVVWNGDTIVDLDLGALLAFHEKEPERGVIVLTRRAGVPNEGAYYVADEGAVLASLEAIPGRAMPTEFAWRGSSTGVLLLPKPLLTGFHSASSLSLEKTILPALVGHRSLRAFDNGTRYFLDFGTPAGLEQLNRDRFLHPLPSSQAGEVSGPWPMRCGVHPDGAFGSWDGGPARAWR
jgi:NDP-sugar pyrophosphorylase family protein